MAARAPPAQPVHSTRCTHPAPPPPSLPTAEHLRAERLLELQREAERRAQLQQAGHGRLLDVAEERLLREAESSASAASASAASASAPLVAHLAFEGSPLDAELDEHLAQLAHRYLGTRFVRTPITLRTTLHLRLRTPAGPGVRGGGKGVLCHMCLCAVPPPKCWWQLAP